MIRMILGTAKRKQEHVHLCIAHPPQTWTDKNNETGNPGRVRDEQAYCENSRCSFEVLLQLGPSWAIAHKAQACALRQLPEYVPQDFQILLCSTPQPILVKANLCQGASKLH